MNDSLQDQTDRVLLRASDIKRWRDEIDKLLAQRKAIEERIQGLKRKLDAAAFLSEPAVVQPTTTRVAIVGAAPEIDVAKGTDIHIGEESMPSAAERIVRNSGKPLSHIEIQGALKQIPEYSERLEQNPNYYYTVIGRLLKRKKIIRRGRKFGPPPPKHENAKDADHA